MYRRLHHQKIAYVLRLLKAPLLNEHSCYFGGGTAITLRYGEFRESVDIDFIISNPDGYRSLRQDIKRNGLKTILLEGALEQLQHSDVRVDQYGIRTRFGILDQWIKFEMIHEGRVELCEAGEEDQICGVKCLAPVDMACSKFLANSDRWADRGVFSRDIIDLAMMDISMTCLKRALAKAKEAYGESTLEDLNKAIDLVKNDRGWLERCMEALSMEMPKAILWNKIRRLKKLLV